MAFMISRTHFGVFVHMIQIGRMYLDRGFTFGKSFDRIFEKSLGAHSQANFAPKVSYVFKLLGVSLEKNPGLRNALLVNSDP